MDTSLFSTFVGISLLVVIVYLSLVYLFGPNYDPREPPVISSLVPFVGHILGLLRYGQRYFEILRSPKPSSTNQTLTNRFPQRSQQSPNLHSSDSQQAHLRRQLRRSCNGRGAQREDNLVLPFCLLISSSSL